jgi:serine/threonine protein kinase/tetratricopeptide (TPR) repeat protein
MTPSNEQDLFDACIRLSPPEQEDFLERACDGDDDLRDRVRRLLAAHLRAEARTLRPLETLSDQAMPDTIGPYELVGVLGEGGMGVVYEAEQRHPVQRRVALKIVKIGMDTRQVVSRFMTERQALAAMDHPFVAKVFDAGETVSGRPFIVMELVRGEPLLEYCERTRLAVRERVALFMLICQAVQHAHQKGVIHRDLKPSNILVSTTNGGAIPKVIDFGIAKAMGRDSAECLTAMTRVDQALGTVAYMSPEQAGRGGIDIDTRTDIYSLGVIFYELLTGTLPTDPRTTGEAKFLAMLASGEIAAPRPSSRVTAYDRRIAGDLDWIVMKALEVDRTRRYDTPNSMADDLERYLKEEPVAARPPTFRYRTGKFVRRHRVEVAAAALVTVALAGGAIAAGVGLVRANRAEAVAKQEAATAQQVSEFLTGLFGASDPNARGTTTLEELLERGTAKLETDLKEQPKVQASLLETLSHVYGSLGRHREAIALAEKSLALDLAAGAETAQTAEALRTLGRSSQILGDFGRARQAFDRAIAIRTRLSGESDLEVARLLNELGSLHGQLESYDEAISAHTRARTIQERLRGSDDIAVANSLGGLAIVHSRRNDYETALQLDRQVLAISQKTYGDNATGTARALENVAWDLKGLKRESEALPYAEQALEIQKRTNGPNHPQIAFTYHLLGGLLEAQGNLDAANTALQEVLRIRETALGPDNPRTADTLNSLGLLKLRAGDAVQSHQYFARALKIFQKAYGPSHSRTVQASKNLAQARDRMDARSAGVARARK